MDATANHTQVPKDCPVCGVTAHLANSRPDTFQTHSDAPSWQVAAYTKRTIVPDHLVGEFTVQLPQPGATEKLSGTLIKKGDENGVVRFTVSSAAAAAAQAAGSVAAAGAPRAPSTPTAVATPAAGAATSGTAPGESSSRLAPAAAPHLLYQSEAGS